MQINDPQRKYLLTVTTAVKFVKTGHHGPCTSHGYDNDNAVSYMKNYVHGV